MEEEILLDVDFAVIELPSNAIEADLNIKVYQDGEVMTVNKLLKLSDIREAFRKAKDGYIDEDDKFVLTEKGYDYLKSLKDKNGAKINKENQETSATN